MTTVSVDFDATYTQHPEAMGEAMDVLLDHGVTVIVVTGRGDHHKPRAEDVIEERFGGRVPVIRVYHSEANNKFTAAELEGYDVDIWWDDQPWHIRPTEERKRRDKERQKIRSEVAHRIDDDASFEEYMTELRREGH